MSFDIQESIAFLRQTPRTLRSLVGDLPSAWLDATEGPDTWNARDVVAHMADLEDSDWMVRVRRILADGTAKAFDPVDRVRFRSTLGSASLNDVLQAFAHRRERNLVELAGLNLGAAELAARGVHPAFGEVTLSQLLATWVVHDLTHLSQVVRVMAGRYAEAVGPWREYLSVLKGLKTE